MRTTLFIVLLYGILAPIATGQPQGPQTADQPSEANPTNSPYTTRGYSLGRGGLATRDPRAMQQLINGWKVSKDAVERDKIEQVLRDALKSEFNDRLAAHEREIKDLEAKVRELRNRLNLRREKQDEIVDHRLQQILREAQGLGWGSESQGHGYGMGGGYGWVGLAGEGGAYGGGYGEYGRYPSVQTAPASAFQPQTAPSALEPVPVPVPEEPPSTSDDLAPTRTDPEPSPARN